MTDTPRGSAALHTCTSDPQQPCEPCTAAYLRIKRSIEEGEAEIAESSDLRSIRSLDDTD